MNYEQSNVGPGMVPCKPGCQCDDCTMDRMHNRNLGLRKRIAELERKLGEVREVIWIMTEHNALHFGARHNTVQQGRALLAELESEDEV